MTPIECYEQAGRVQGLADNMQNKQYREKLRDIADMWEWLGYTQEPVQMPAYPRD